MAWHFVSAGAHAPHSDQTLGPTPGAAHSARRLRSLASLCSSFTVGDMDKGWDVALKIEQGLELDRRFG